MSSWRKVGSFALMVGFLALTTATSKPKKTSSSSGYVPPPTYTPTTTTPTTSPTPTSKPLGARPADVDIVEINNTLGCSRTSTKPGCRLLTEFDDADTWSDMPIIDAVWYGEATAIGGDVDGKKDLFFLQIGAGTTPATFLAAVKTLVPDNDKEKQEATRLLWAVKGGGAVPGSESAKFMKRSGGERKLVQLTRGKSHALEGQGVYIRKKGLRVLVVEYTGGSPIGHRIGSAKAWVAETWKLNQ
jgi:hypothetical protein